MNTKKMVLLSSITIITVIIFLSFFFSRLPYGFYQILKLVAFLSSCFLAYDSQKESNNSSVIIFIILAIFYNPIFPIHLTKAIWLPINIATVGYFTLSYTKAT